MINERHYRQIARAAERAGVSYDQLAARYESGTPIDVVLATGGRNLHIPNDVWIDTEQAARILGTTKQNLPVIAAPEWYGIDARLRSKRPDVVSSRGNGWLLRRTDVEDVAHIKDLAHVSLRNALRFYRAARGGALSSVLRWEGSS